MGYKDVDMKEWLGLAGFLLLFSGQIHAGEQPMGSLQQLIQKTEHSFAWKTLSTQKPIKDIEQKKKQFSTLYRQFKVARDQRSVTALKQYVQLFNIAETAHDPIFWKKLEQEQGEVISLYFFWLEDKVVRFNSLLVLYGVLHEPNEMVSYLMDLEQLANDFKLLQSVFDRVDKDTVHFSLQATIQKEPYYFFKSLQEHSIKVESYLNYLLREYSWTPEQLVSFPLKVRTECSSQFTRRKTGTTRLYVLRTLTYFLSCSDATAAFQRAGRTLKTQLNRLVQQKSKFGTVKLDRHGDIISLEDIVMEEDLTTTDLGKAIQKGGQQFVKHLLKRSFIQAKDSIGEWDAVGWVSEPDLTEYVFVAAVGLAVSFLATTDISLIHEALQNAQVNFEVDLRDLRPFLRKFLPQLDSAELNRMLLKVELKGLDIKELGEASQKLTLQYEGSENMKVRLFSELGQEEEDKDNIVAGIEVSFKQSRSKK